MIDAITCRRVALECYAQVFDTVTLCRGWRVVEGRIAVDEDAMLPLRAAEEVGRSVIPCRETVGRGEIIQGDVHECRLAAFFSIAN